MAGGRGIAPPPVEENGLLPARGGRGIAPATCAGFGVANGLLPGRGGFGSALSAACASPDAAAGATGAGGVGATGGAGGRGTAETGAVDPAEIPNWFHVLSSSCAMAASISA